MLFYGLGRKIVGVFPQPAFAEHSERAHFRFFFRRKFMSGRKNLVKALVRSGSLTFPRNAMLGQAMRLGGLTFFRWLMGARRCLRDSAQQPYRQQENSRSSKNKCHFTSSESLILSPRSRLFTTAYEKRRSCL